ncbi:MAG: DMT family transporter [Alphaproteobacteria bacterium]|nr:DMT family transporter [Alphaproteobacteria bacterium]
MTSSNPSTVAMTRLDYTLYGLVVLIWGSTWIALRLQLGVVAPEVSVLWRFCVALVFMVPLVLIRKDRLIFPFAMHLRFALLGSLLFSSNFIFFYYAGLTTPTGLLAVVFSLASIINLLLGALLARKRPSTRLAIGGLIGAIGSGLMFAPQIIGQPFGYIAIQGLIYCLLGTLSFCGGNIIAASVQRRGVSVFSSALWGMVYGILGMAAFIALEGGSFTIEWTLPYWSALVFLAMFGSVIAFASYLTLLGRIGPARASYSTVLYPVIALVLSTALEGYQWTLPAILGLGFVLMGNVVVLRNPK